jgi:hypothetical protein
MTDIQTTVEPLRFTVRDRLQIHRQVVLERWDGTQKIRDARVESYGSTFGRTTIELMPDEVKTYAHALEPIGERSAAALEALHFKPPVRAPDINHEHARIAHAVAATISALDKAGLLRLRAKPPSEQ